MGSVLSGQVGSSRKIAKIEKLGAKIYAVSIPLCVCQDKLELEKKKIENYQIEGFLLFVF